MAGLLDKPYSARLEVGGQMATVGVGSMVGLALCLFAARFLLPRLFPAQMGALSESRRFFVAQCVASGLHALVSGPVATYVMYQLLFSGDYPVEACPAQPNAGTVRAPPLAVWVTGFTCGYFVYDSLVMAVYAKYCEEEMGKSGTLLMWIHHVISVIVWPYCIASDRAVMFVGFFLFTELTNIGQAIFLIINKGKIGGSTAEGIVGGSWALSFFLTRIVTIPWLLMLYYSTILSPGCMNVPDRLLGFFTVPMPIGLNVYWFMLIVRKARRMLAPSKPKAV